ncbi:MAG TPA: glycosyltransferase family 87 protein [Candidatus Limnocylindrales bacterium]
MADGARKVAAAITSLAHSASRLIPARLRRIHVPSAYSAIDRTTVVAIGLVCGIFQAVGRFPLPQDAWTYWTADLNHLYPERWGPDALYIYPPPLAQITTLLQPVGWQIFIVCWTTLLWAALAYMLGRWAWLFVALGIATLLFGLPFAFGDVLGHSLNGNVQLLITAGIVAALRGNALGWLPGLLTKVVLGIGLGWYVLRLEWRPLAISLGATATVAVVSFAFAPSQWAEWIAWTVKNAGVPPPVELDPVPFILRLPVCLALLTWGARTNRAVGGPDCRGLEHPGPLPGHIPQHVGRSHPAFPVGAQTVASECARSVERAERLNGRGGAPP